MAAGNTASRQQRGRPMAGTVKDKDDLPEGGASTDDGANADEFDTAFDEFSGDDAGDDGADSDGQSASDDGEDSASSAESDVENSSSDDEEKASAGNAGDDGADDLAVLRKQIEDLTHQQKSDRGRIAAYQRQVAELQEQPSAKKAGDANDDDGDAGDDEDPDITAFKAEYPEVAGPIGKLLSRQQRTIESLQKELGGVSADRRQANLDQQVTVLEEAHPDWKDITGSSDFREWAEAQPKYVMDALQRNGNAIVDGAEAAHILGLFKGQHAGSNPAQSDANGGDSDTSKKLADKRKRQMESAASVPNKGPGASSGPPEDFDAAFDHYAAKPSR